MKNLIFFIKHRYPRLFSLFLVSGILLMFLPQGAWGSTRSTVEGLMTINGSPASGAVIFLEGPSPALPPGKGGAVTIRQKGKQFHPALTVITLGTPIRFENLDNEIHNIQSTVPPNRFDTGAHMPGTVREVLFKHPGPVPLQCRTHENMKATVFVSPTPFYAVTDETGGYRIPNIPQGEFRISAWHPRLTEKERDAGTKDLLLPNGRKSVDLAFNARGSEGQKAPLNERDWRKTVQEIGQELDIIVSLWEKGKKTVATRRVMSTLFRLYGDSGLKKAIEHFYDKDRAAGYEKRFDALRKQVQGIGSKEATAAGLRQEAEHLTRDLLRDAEEMTKDLPRQIHR